MEYDHKMEFIEACKSGNLTLAMKLYNGDDTYGLLESVANNGHVEVLKWLYSVSKHSSKLRWILRAYMKTFNYEMADWLYDIGAIDVNQDVFITVCRNQRWDWANWMIDKNVKVVSEKAIRVSKSKWIFHQRRIVPYQFHDDVYKYLTYN
jgi:hypothetical protein